MEKAQGITSAYTPRMTEDDLSPSVSPPSLWRQLEDFRQTLDAASPPETAPEQRPNPRAKSDAFLQARWPRKLTELPEANAYAAVYRVIDGCEEPVMVRFDVGGR